MLGLESQTVCALAGIFPKILQVFVKQRVLGVQIIFWHDELS